MSHIRQNSFGLLVKINEMSTCNPFVEFQKEMYALEGGWGEGLSTLKRVTLFKDFLSSFS